MSAVVEAYSAHLNPSLARLMSFAGFGEEATAEGCWITDAEGRRYLDCLGGYGVFSLGHSHPKVIETVKDQLGRMPLSGKAFFCKPAAEAATKLAALAPEGLDYVFFSNSGAEAVEAALKFARIATGRTEFVSTHGGYHGKTLGALSVTGREKYRKPFEPLVPGARFVPFGDADALLSAVDEGVAAVIVEAIQGEGGIKVPADGYLKAARQACDASGALLILDEVQTGLGRTGTWWGCDHDGVKPDLMTLAKALGGGVMPIGATMGTEAIWEKVYGENPLLHTSTFGGGPTACAAALAALNVIEEEGLVEKSREAGDDLMAKLREAAGGSDLVAEVRGRGLMIGVEFAQDEVAELVTAQMMKRGVVAAYTLNNPRVLRFEPPLSITEEERTLAATAFGGAVEETSELLAML